jgi:hypothetical protein
MEQLLIVILTSFMWGQILSHYTRYLLSTETQYNPFVIRFFTLPIVAVVCVIMEVLMYQYHGIRPMFFLYSGFGSVLLTVTCTDFLEETIDDRAILWGIIYVLIFQSYVGQAIFALMGGAFAFLISFAIFIFGNRYFTLSNVQTEEEMNLTDSQTSLRFALVPSLSVAVIIHALLPEGLANFLYGVLVYIQNHVLVLISVVVFATLLLIWAMQHRTITSPATMGAYSEEDNTMTAFGDGDITTSVFLGVVLGMENFIAVFWLGMVVHSLIGVTLRIKQRGSVTWI